LHRIAAGGPWRERVARVDGIDELLKQPALWLSPPNTETRADEAATVADAAPANGNFLDAIRPAPRTRPVFVLGAGRSGTSAMVGAMRAAGIPGHHEGHVFPMLQAMLARVAEKVDGASRAEMLRTIADSTVTQAFAEFGEGTWLNKTPDHPMIECVPLVRALYPEARFIMMRRHPIPFIESRRRKFGDPVPAAVNEWLKCIEAWKSQRAALPPSCYIECDAEALRDESMRDRLCEFLEVDADKRTPFNDYLLSERPELTRVGSQAAALEKLPGERGYNLRSIFYSMLDALGERLEDMAWTPEEKREVETLIGALAEECGYPLHRSDDRVVDLLLEWATRMEEYRYTAERLEQNAAKWVAAARAQAEQHRLAAEHHQKAAEDWAAAARRQEDLGRAAAEAHKKSSADWAAAVEHYKKSSEDWAAEAARQREEADRQREQARLYREKPSGSRSRIASPRRNTRRSRATGPRRRSASWRKRSASARRRNGSRKSSSAVRRGRGTRSGASRAWAG
jgi:hypothetical protein